MPSFDQVLRKITNQRMLALEAEKSRVVVIDVLPTREQHMEALIERRADPLPD